MTKELKQSLEEKFNQLKGKLIQGIRVDTGSIQMLLKKLKIY